MASNDSRAFRPDPAFLLRTPMLPFDALVAWANDLGLEGLAADDAAGQAIYARAIERLRARARDLARDPAVREAIFIASSSLEESLFASDALDGARAKAAEPALARYLSRMMSRATPFGLFSGCALGAVGTRTRLVLGREPPKRVTRLDMDYLCASCAALARVPEIAAQLTYRPNDSLYRVAGHLRYSEIRGDGAQRRYQIVQLEATEPVERVLDRAKNGASRASLAESVRELDPDEISRDDAGAFVRDLIDTQVLVSDLSPLVTGGDALAEIIAQLSRLEGEGPRVAAVLERAHAMLAEIDRAPLGVAHDAVDAPDRYRAVRAALATLPAPAPPNQLFQVDVVRRAPSAELSRALTDELLAAVQIARRLEPPAKNDLLGAFATTFVDRYGDREVPLTEALDPEFGIPFTPDGRGAERAPLLAGLHLPKPGASSNAGSVHPHLLRKLEHAWARGEREIRLTEEDVQKLESPKSAPLPDAFAVIAVVAAGSEEAVARGDYRLVFNGSHGPSGMRTLGRFCHVDEALDAHVRAHLRAEEALRPDAAFAEIVHRPEERLGNIIARPVLREHEIAFLGRSSTAAPLPLDDLRVSVRNGRVVLRSVSLEREVLPRLTTALNVQHGTSLHFFLATLQTQDADPPARWSWGALGHAKRLPRVSFGRIVLRREQWRLDAHDLERLGDSQGPARFLAARRLREEHGMPRFVRLVDGDNELTVDFDNPLLVEAFVSTVAKRESCVLAEMFPAPEDLLCEGEGGRYTHELVVSFVRREPPPAREPLRPTASTAPRLPGGECLFVKLYGGRVSLEPALTSVLGPLLDSGLEEGWFHTWFFLRYADPELHLRLRFFGDSRLLNERLLPRLHEAASALQASGRIWRMQLDTYVPETERYGGPSGVKLAERLFHVESQAVLELLALLDEGEDETTRWRTALRGVDDLLDALGLTFDEKWGVARRLRATFGRELSADSTSLKHELGASFRAHRARVERDLDRAADEDSDLAPFLEVLGALAAAREPIVRELREEERRGSLTRPVTELAESYVHMFLNRLLRPPSRPQELVIYEYACRAYESRAARAKRAKPPA